jgi:hypothetical protein
MKKISKYDDLNMKFISCAMFMATVSLYVLVGFIYGRTIGENFYYHVSFPLLIQGVVVSMVISKVWVFIFGLAKSWNFLTRYLLFLAILVVLLGASMLIPFINSIEGYYLWIFCGAFSILAFSTAFSVISAKQFSNTGSRCTIVWELFK